MFNHTFPNNINNYSYRLIQNEMLALVIILSAFAILGSIGNSLATFVFYKVRDKSTAQIFILTMSVIDLFTCTVIIPFTIVVEYLRFDIRHDIVCKMYQFLITSKVPLSAFIMVAIAFDRYFCICHPLRRIVTPFRMKFVIVSLTLFACSLGIITCLAYGVYREASRSSFNPHNSNVVDWRPIVDEPISTNDANGVVLEAFLEEFLKGNKSQILSTFGSRSQIVYIGICIPNNLILDITFLHIYQKIYSVLFVACLAMVGVLYGLIFRFIQIRRSRKLQQKLVLCSYLSHENGFEGTRLTLLNGGDDEHGKEDKESLCDDHTLQIEHNNKDQSRRRTSSFLYDANKLREETRSANIKTAIMLFTVTVVFVVAFLPAWLMAHKLIPTNIVVYYMYFSYNVINPCIYAFMNPVFQENLKTICRRSAC